MLVKIVDLCCPRLNKIDIISLLLFIQEYVNERRRPTGANGQGMDMLYIATFLSFFAV